ncbi:type 1 glutamine amidotransferase [Neptunicoccus cionae]|uniref:Glutamine amidotransferase n=1 Tax=Neptunicoccus cionae TaxID=2035344 RepID=A0A916VR18_9RHOB|nr:type 1 glutamine amidotransferase [Amylibacter cionae]GGA20230.1 glutamine amidotransferase [Amylibacter cionae]
MKIGILQTGHTPEEMREKHGDYDDLFKRLLAGRGLHFETYPVLDGILPDTIMDADGWLITGSKFGVYEDHDWIPPLEDFLRRAYAAAIPIVGVCFGHQILAQALGGKVEKFSGGWQVGPVDYARTDGRNDRIMAWHQDQITQVPEGAAITGTTDFCANAMLVYGDRALTVQPHPEFTPEFMGDLLAARGDILPDAILTKARAGLQAHLDSPDYAQMFEDFFRRNAKPT